MSPEVRIKLHTWLACLWFMLAILTTGWAFYDPENRFLLAWIIFMSAYANTASHWSAREGAAPSADDDILKELSPKALEQIEEIVERINAQGRTRGGSAMEES